MSKISTLLSGTICLFDNSHIIIVLKRITFSFFLMLLLAFQLRVDSKVFFLQAEYYQDKTQTKGLVVGKGEIISSDKPIVRVAISDPSIIDIQILNEKQVFVRASMLGISTLLVWEKGLSSPSRFDVSVIPDIDYLTKQLHELDENIIVEYIPPTSGSVSGDSMQSQPSPLGGGETPPGGEGGQGGGGEGQAASPFGGGQSSSSSQATSGRIILKGQVKNAEIIARALQIAGAYIGDQGIKIISQPGGQIVDGLAGDYNIANNPSGGEGGGGEGGSSQTITFGGRDAIKFISNRYANLSRGVIATTQKGSVVSFLTIKDPPQISVAIKFYEISRNLARNLGFNATFGGHTLQGGTFIGGDALSMISAAIGSISKLNNFMAGSGQGAAELTFGDGKSAGGSFLSQEIGQGVTGAIFYPKSGIGALIQALQERGEIKTLAEPTLVIANGEPAAFLAGGEVPIVRSVLTASGTGQDVSYEPFGIRFSFLPLVTGEDRIFLQLVPEIREIDTEISNLVVPPGSTSIRPPAFKTKRTQTQIELEAGQAFAISGLLKEETVRNLKKVPGIGDIPILGALFRSKSFRKGESELLIVVSPEIIKPTSPDKIAKSLSVPEVPYRDFNFVAPLRPFIEKKDEIGPTLQKPIDPKKYHLEDSEKQSMEIKGYEQPLTNTRQVETDFNQVKNTLETVIQMKDKEIQEAKKALEIENKAKEIEKEKASKAIEEVNKRQKELEEAKKALSTQYSALPPQRGEARSAELSGSTPAPSERGSPKDIGQQLVSKEEKKKLKLIKKQAELASKRQELARLWKLESARYQNAKETMKQARKNLDN